MQLEPEETIERLGFLLNLRIQEEENVKCHSPEHNKLETVKWQRKFIHQKKTDILQCARRDGHYQILLPLELII